MATTFEAHTEATLEVGSLPPQASWQPCDFYRCTAKQKWNKIEWQRYTNKKWREFYTLTK